MGALPRLFERYRAMAKGAPGSAPIDVARGRQHLSEVIGEIRIKRMDGEVIAAMGESETLVSVANST